MDSFLKERLETEVPPEVDARLRQHLAAFRERMESRESTWERWRRILLVPRWRVAVRYAIPAAVLLLAGLMFWPRPGAKNGPLAFADVLEQLREFRPYACTQTWEYDGKPPYNLRVMRDRLTRRREERDDGSIRVFDMSQEDMRLLTLFPQAKYASEITYMGRGPTNDPDLLRMLAEMRDGETDDLGVREIDGRMAQGFHGLRGRSDFTVWADPETGLPVRVKIRQDDLARTLVMSDFEWDAEMDESLFSTTAPEGYTVHRTTKDRVGTTTNVAYDRASEHIRRYACTYTVENENGETHTYRLMRWDLSRRREVMPDGTVVVVDMSDKPIRVLELFPAEKRARLTVKPDRGPLEDPDILNMADVARVGGAEFLGDDIVEGRDARVYLQMLIGNEITYWIDLETELPLRVEIVHAGTGRQIIMSEFEWDIELDESLFSTTAPEGYAVERIEQEG
jgi:outer membrane lipoprotein-sorting protein